MAGGPIHVMEAEHDDHAESLRETAGSRTASSAGGGVPHVARPHLRLAAFEAELMDHIHLENNVLFRRVLAAGPGADP
jgi:regulator of cell morphogenesis and NO signaling